MRFVGWFTIESNLSSIADIYVYGRITGKKATFSLPIHVSNFEQGVKN